MSERDSNVEAVREKLLRRSDRGIAKYGTTTNGAAIDLLGWLQHLQEELLDAAVYVEAALAELESPQKPLGNAEKGQGQ